MIMRCAKKMLRAFCFGALCLFLGSCTSIASKVDSDKTVNDGLVYFMPRRPIQITVTVDDKGNQTPKVETANTISDPSQRFVLDYSEDFFGKNHMNVTVNSLGLLSSTLTETTSGWPTIAKNLGTLTGQVTALAAAAAEQGVTPGVSVPQCDNGKSYTLLLFPEDAIAKGSQTSAEFPLCGFNVVLKRLAPILTHNTSRIEDKEFQSGVFYKFDLPYIVTISQAGLAQGVKPAATSFIALSPDESPIAFAPVTRTVFSDNKVTLTFSDGILTADEQSSDGEVVALSELPADFISAYMSAIGSIFSSLSTNATDQKNLISAQQSLAVTQVKLQACQQAIAANSVAGKTQADAAKALSNVQAACQ
jgi:hypothetical protein